MKSLRKTDQWVDEPSWASARDDNEVTWTTRRTTLDFLRVSAVALGTATFWMFVIWAIHRQSPRTLVSFHGFVHAAIADKFLDPASTAFPPENPFFAGRPVSYYWFFQFLAAQLTRYLGWNIFYSLEAVTLAATGVLAITAVGLGRALYRSTLAGVLMSYLVMAGTNPLGFLFAGWRIASRGMQVLLDDPNYLWGVVHPLYSLIRYNDFGGIYGPLLNFFLNQTSRAAALACLMAQLFFLEWSLRSGRRTAWLSLGCASALCTAFSPITGISAGGALLIGIIGSWLWERHITKDATHGVQICNKKLITAGLAIVTGIFIASPTYYHLVFGPSTSQVQFRLFSSAGFRDLVTIVLSVIVLVVLAVVGIIRSSWSHRSFLLALFFAAIVLLVANAAFLIPPGNESNFFHAATVLLAVPAAGSVLRPGTKTERVTLNRRFVGGTTLVFLPTVLLLLAAYLDRPPLPATFDGPRLARLPKDSAFALFYRWVQTETSPDAVFILDPRQRVAMCGNAAEFPAMTGRVLFIGELNHYLVEPYPDAKRRVEIAVRLLFGDRLTQSDGTYLLQLHRPVYIVNNQSSDGTLFKRLEERYGHPIFQRGELAVFKWRT